VEMGQMSVTIRDLKNYDEMVAVRHLQQDIWGFDDPNIGLYPPLLNTAAKNGGVVLGAFDDETGQMVGFLFSFLGREPGGPFKLCSQNMGIKTGWRRHGIAEALKQLQRQRTIEQELPLITWTYDPLEGPNANLNLHKLRAITRTYWRDVYGSNFGTLNVGLPTDRLLVEWWVKGSRLDEEPDEEYEELVWDSPSIFESKGESTGRWIARADLSLDSEMVLLETPPDIHPLKKANIELALDWRLKVRNAFEKYFDKGYIAVDFISTIERGERRNRYVLQKGTPKLLAEIGIETQ
jgi:predicted GNAT superfamily acetyltransferase